jgi:hypothetical protein
MKQPLRGQPDIRIRFVAGRSGIGVAMEGIGVRIRMGVCVLVRLQKVERLLNAGIGGIPLREEEITVRPKLRLTQTSVALAVPLLQEGNGALFT